MSRILRLNYRLWLLSLFSIPFVQGGYFNYALMIFGSIQSLNLLILLIKGKLRLEIKSIRIIPITMFVLSVIAIPASVDVGMHLFGILRMLIPVFVIIIYDSYKSLYPKELNRHISLVFVLGGMFMSFIVLSTTAFLSRYHPIPSFFIQNNRVGGFFQYANTFGIYIFGILILSVYLEMNKYFRSAMLILLSMTIIVTQSRTVFIILILYIFILIILSKKNRKDSIFIIFGILFGHLFLQVFLTTFQTYRSFDLNPGVGEFQSRLLYYEDGLRMLCNKPTGFGYMGYYYIQRFFQTGASYRVRFIHSSILQASLDFGFLAGGILIGQLVFGLKNLYHYFREKKVRNIIALVGLTGYFLHSFVDFDFQFMAYVIFLYLCFILIDEAENEELLQKKVSKGLKVTWICIVTFMLSGFIYFMVPAIYAYQGEYEKALKIYPNYTKAMTEYIEETKDCSGELVEHVKHFTRQNEYYYEGFAFLREYYYNNGDLKKSLFYSYRCKELAPLWIKNYERHVDILYGILHARYESGTLTTKDALFYEIFDMPRELERLEEERSNDYNIRHKVEFKLTPKMTRKISMAYQLYEFAMK